MRASIFVLSLLWCGRVLLGQERPEERFPPALPEGRTSLSETSDKFLTPGPNLRPGVALARTPPRVDFAYYPGQDYPGQPWSNWGDSLAVGGKYYSAIGDHLAIGAKGDGRHGTGTARVFAYDPADRSFTQLADVSACLQMPAGHYTPGKIHSRLDLGSDGWLYYATHRGSTRVTTDQYHYQGDWILRTHPHSGETEVVARGPVPKHCIPNSVLDPERLIFYGGTAAGTGKEEGGVQFFAYDVRQGKVLYAGPDGPARYMILAKSTGRVYYVPGNRDGRLMRFDPATGGPPVELAATLGVRAATQETPDGIVYSVSSGQGADDATLWAFHVATEQVERLGGTAVGTNAYIASIDADPTGRYLYYVPGAHGGSDRDGSPVVQYDVRTRRAKVLAFLHPYFQDNYGFALKGTYGTAVDPAGDKLYITWNVSRGSRAWDCCGLTVIHIPPSERP